jgi:hypothetical protein
VHHPLLTSRKGAWFWENARLDNRLPYLSGHNQRRSIKEGRIPMCRRCIY